MKSNLEVFSERVASVVLDITPDKLAAGTYALDIATILALIQVIGQIVTQISVMCPNQKGLVRSVLTPSWMQKVYTRVVVSQICNGCDNAKIKALSGKIANALISESGKLKEEDVAKLVDDTAFDNMLI